MLSDSKMLFADAQLVLKIVLDDSNSGLCLEYDTSRRSRKTCLLVTHNKIKYPDCKF